MPTILKLQNGLFEVIGTSSVDAFGANYVQVRKYMNGDHDDLLDEIPRIGKRKKRYEKKNYEYTPQEIQEAVVGLIIHGRSREAIAKALGHPKGGLAWKLRRLYNEKAIPSILRMAGYDTVTEERIDACFRHDRVTS